MLKSQTPTLPFNLNPGRCASAACATTRPIDPRAGPAGDRRDRARSSATPGAGCLVGNCATPGAVRGMFREVYRARLASRSEKLARDCSTLFAPAAGS